MTAFEHNVAFDSSVVAQISRWRGEPEWMLDVRLHALRVLRGHPPAEWSAAGLSGTGVQHIFDRLSPAGEPPDDVGVAPRHESEAVLRDRAALDAQGVLFCDMDTALRQYPQIVEEYFGTIVAPGDDLCAALNTAVWSGGSFIYVPPGVSVEMPLQTDRRTDERRAGQFARTLIIADTGSSVHYIDGCSAPVYTKDALQAATVEIAVEADAHVSYTTIQNWSPNVHNLVTARARVEADGHLRWIDGNIGSKRTTKCPEIHLVGDGATGAVLSVSCAGRDRHQDVGATMVHAAPNTTSRIISRSISKDGGVATSTCLVRVEEGVTNTTSHVDAEALLLDADADSIPATRPSHEIDEDDALVSHEAILSRVSDDQRFRLMSRGLSGEQAVGLIVSGFIEPITAALPMEYAVEWSRLIELQIEGSVG